MTFSQHFSVLEGRELCVVLFFLNQRGTRKLESSDSGDVYGFYRGQEGRCSGVIFCQKQDVLFAVSF